MTKLDDQLKKVEERLKKLKEAKRAQEAKEKQRKKKENDHVKILIGAYYISTMGGDDEGEKIVAALEKLKNQMDKFLTRDRDRLAFGLPLLQKEDKKELPENVESDNLEVE